MPDSPLKSLNDDSDALEKFIGEFVKAWRSRDWLRVAVRLLMVIVTAGSLPALVALWKDFSTYPTPAFFVTSGWVLVILGLFIWALIAAIRKQKNQHFIPDRAEQIYIKGLYPFETGDAQLFAHLQREKDIARCLNVLTASSFRVGLLDGESGCGKTSFLRAGIAPRINASSSLQCVYVEFTDRDPFETIERALKEQLVAKPALSVKDETSPSLFPETEKPLLLLFDQFEQFLIGQRANLSNHPFVQALKSWFESQDRHRILFCVRSEFVSLFLDLQRIIQFSLPPQQLISLKKFTPDQATDVIAVLALRSGLEFDRDFVKEITREELAHRDDGLVSPVDLQIVLWVISDYPAGEQVAFSRSTFQKLGGVEGLLARFLRKVIETSGRDSKTDLRVLLALSDLQNNVRAGELTESTIRERMEEPVGREAVQNTLNYLSSSTIRLVLANENRYKLAHERLIPALRNVAGRILEEDDKLNLLFEQRVNEWLGNARSDRYLLSWQEWRQIKSKKAKLINGSRETAKRELLQQTSRHWYRRGLAVGVLGFLVAGASGWLLLTSAGQLQRTQWEMGEYKSYKNPVETRKWASLALAASGDLEESLHTTETFIIDTAAFGRTCDTIASFVQKRDSPGDLRYLIKSEYISSSTKVLHFLIEDYVSTRNKNRLDFLLKTAEESDTLDREKVLIPLAVGYSRLRDKEGMDRILQLAPEQRRDYLRAEILLPLAQGYAQIKDQNGLQRLFQLNPDQLIANESIDLVLEGADKKRLDDLLKLAGNPSMSMKFAIRYAQFGNKAGLIQIANDIDRNRDSTYRDRMYRAIEIITRVVAEKKREKIPVYFDQCVLGKSTLAHPIVKLLSCCIGVGSERDRADILKLVPEFNNFDLEALLHQLAVFYNQAGDKKGLDATVALLPALPWYYRYNVLLELAEGYNRLQDETGPARIREITKEIEGKVIFSVCSGYIRQHQRERLDSVWSKGGFADLTINDKDFKALVRDYAQLVDQAGARALFGLLQEKWGFTFQMNTYELAGILVGAYPRLKDREGLDQLANRLPDMERYYADSLLIAMAKCSIELEDSAACKKRIKRIASFYSTGGDEEGILRMAYKSLAGDFARRKDFAGLDRMVRLYSFTPDPTRIWVDKEPKLAAARAYAQLGDVKSVNRALRMATEFNLMDREKLLFSLIKTANTSRDRLKMKQLHFFIWQTFYKNSNYYYSDSLFVPIAQGFAQFGHKSDLDDFMKRRIFYGESSAVIISALTDGYGRVRDKTGLDQIKEQLPNMSNDQLRWRVITQLIKNYVKLGEIRAARNLLINLSGVHKAEAMYYLLRYSAGFES